jgi:hypothetical protein
MPRCRSRRSGPLLRNEIGDRTGALHLRGTRRALALRHPHQTTARESVEWPLTESAQTSHGATAPGDNDLAAPLHSLQVLAKAVVQLAHADLAPGLM